MYTVKSKAGKSSYHWDYQEFLYLVHLLDQAKDFKEILNLFIDLHTHQEIAEITRRVLIASMLYEGKTYSEIREATNSSPSTIAKIHQKFYREKTVMDKILAKAGNFEDFNKNKAETRDRLSQFIDKTLFNKSPITIKK